MNEEIEKMASEIFVGLMIRDYYNTMSIVNGVAIEHAKSALIMAEEFHAQKNLRRRRQNNEALNRE